jgi:cytochrome c553
MNRPALAAFSLLVAAGAAGAVDANLGRDVAANCTSCHGTDGRSRGGIPSLVGQDRLNLVQQMRDFRDGKRPSTIMQQLAKGYSDAEIEAAAAYLSAQRAD